MFRLAASDITLDHGTPDYTYGGKGGATGHRELPGPAFEAIERTLADRGTSLAALPPDQQLWGISDSTFYGRFRRYLADAGLPASGLHVLRHSAAKLRREAGATVEQVSAWLDHSSISTTSIYLRRLEGQRDESWQGMAQAIGV